MPKQESVVGASAYPYSHEVLVELTCRDADGQLMVYSYPFEPLDGDTCRPVEAVPDRHREAVTDALAEKDYEAEPTA